MRALTRLCQLSPVARNFHGLVEAGGLWWETASLPSHVEDEGGTTANRMAERNLFSEERVLSEA